MKSNLDRVREYVTGMPSLPTTVAKVLEICNNPKTSPVDLNRVISMDPVLMGRVLKLINSAYYGLGTQITSLVRAIIMLGINTVKNLALSTAVLGNFSKGNHGKALNMDGFWRHSLAVAVTGRILAKRRGVDQTRQEEYFAAGLLHDIGKIPLNAVLSEGYVRTMAVSDRERVEIVVAEREAMGIDHAEVGGIIAEAWKLDRVISDVLRFHHAPSECPAGGSRDVLLTIMVADWFVNREEIGFAGNRYPQKPGPEVFSELGMTREDLEDVGETVNAEVEKAKVFLKLS